MKVGRNDSCSCGSGKRYKKCCLNEGYALRLCDMVSQSEELSLAQGKKEIWAVGIVYAIAQLNFLFDPEGDDYLSSDEIISFFQTKKSTVSSKARGIRESLDLYHGHRDLCRPEIVRMFEFYETEEGFVIPASMLKELGHEADGGKLVDQHESASRGITSDRTREKTKTSRKNKVDDKQLFLFEEDKVE